MFNNFSKRSKGKSQYRPIDHDSENEDSGSGDDESPQEEPAQNHNGETNVEMKVINRLPPISHDNSSISPPEYGILISEPSADEQSQSLHSPTRNEDISDDSHPSALRRNQRSESPSHHINIQISTNENTTLSSTPQNTPSRLYRLPILLQNFFSSRRAGTEQTTQETSEEPTQTTSPTQDQPNNLNTNENPQIIQISYQDQVDIDEDEDDPLCHQALLVFGMCCNYPFLWVIGAILWCITPKSHHRSRMWGLSNLVMSAFFFLYLFFQVQIDPELFVEDISYIPTHRHHMTGQSSLGTSGSFFSRSNEIILNRNNFELGNWTGFVFEQSIDNHKQSLKQLEPVTNPQLDSFIKWDHVFSGVMSNSIKMNGRILLETTFSREGLDATGIYTPSQIFNCLDQNVDRIPKSVFPSDISFENCLTTDEIIPPEFIGSGLRCKKDTQYHWFLQWRPEIIKTSENFTSSSVINFEDIYFCTIILISPIKLSYEPYTLSNIIEIKLRVLPAN